MIWNLMKVEIKEGFSESIYSLSNSGLHSLRPRCMYSMTLCNTRQFHYDQHLEVLDMTMLLIEARTEGDTPILLSTPLA